MKKIFIIAAIIIFLPYLVIAQFRVLVPITIRDNGTSSRIDTFGVHVNASYCIDGRLDPELIERELGPRPPVGNLDARFTDSRSGSGA
ncbi:MAG TPA: hypothetical protein VFF29_04040, partial [Bacteroidota bacterium]|nr:hypothetical protein [Bacteroidota bacterium]